MLKHQAAAINRRMAPAVAPIAIYGFEHFTTAALFLMKMIFFFILIDCPSTAVTPEYGEPGWLFSPQPLR
jgi:hypothetical protein